MNRGAMTLKGKSSAVSPWADAPSGGGGWSHCLNSAQVKTTRPVFSAESSLAIGSDTAAPPICNRPISSRTGPGHPSIIAEISTTKNSCSAAAGAGACAGAAVGRAGVFGRAKGITPGVGVFGPIEGNGVAPGGLANDGSRAAGAAGFGRAVGSACVVGGLVKCEAPVSSAAGLCAANGMVGRAGIAVPAADSAATVLCVVDGVLGRASSPRTSGARPSVVLTLPAAGGLGVGNGMGAGATVSAAAPPAGAGVGAGMAFAGSTTPDAAAFTTLLALNGRTLPK
ncbi:MAG: hypothetical protein ABSA47_18985, partial [Verrucomicrobiota bacterium]